jgi:serine/threonine-protein kinase
LQISGYSSDNRIATIPVQAMTLETGDRLGRYKILAPLGAGGMGEVYRAVDPRLEREVALKVLPAETLTDEVARARMLREARMAARLNHPHVCTVHEVGEADGQIYIAMELVEGQSLATIVADGPLPVEQAVHLGTQVADALAHAHERGVVHRDLKSGNVVITPEGRAKVLDFGLAKQLVGEELAEATTEFGATLTVPGSVVGTLAYMAPEQLRGRPADVRSDVWALGVVLYEMLGGRRPFLAETGFALSAAILNEPPPPLPASVPAGIRTVVERCLEKAPGDRFQTAEEVRTVLETVQSGGVVTVPTQRALVPLGRYWTMAAIMAVAVILAVLAALDVGGVRHLVLGRGGQPQAVRMAVLPFVNLTGDPDQEYLSDGITQEMITQLGRLHPQGLSVIARTSVMRYKGGDTPVDQIGRELGVEYVLEGSARREADRIRITAELIQVGDQTQLWADSYERELAGILIVQAEVAREVAGALALELLPAEQARLTSPRRVDSEAYDAYLKGTYHWQRLTPADLDTAERYFQLALEKDPDFAMAYAGLSAVWAGRRQMRITPAVEAGQKAKAAALNALELDDGLAAGHTRLAGVLAYTDYDPAGAEREYRRAIELDPNDPIARSGYSHLLMSLRRPDEAMQQIERALELDPLNVMTVSFYAIDLLFVRRFDEALAEAERALRLQPDAPVARSAQNYAWLAKGMYTELLAYDRARIAGDPELSEAFERGYSEAGYEGAERRRADVTASRYDTPGGRSALVIAHMYVCGGAKKEALDWLERAYEDHDPNLPFLGMPVWDPLRDEPRFQELLRRMGLPSD